MRKSLGFAQQVPFWRDFWAGAGVIGQTQLSLEKVRQISDVQGSPEGLYCLGLGMEKEALQSELARLRKMQHDAEQLEVFVGMTNAERAEYNARAKRINELEMERLAKAAKAEKRGEQERQWNKPAETDTPQDEARQPYRSREKVSSESHDKREGREAIPARESDE
jgi:hypothetical protein